ncbi:hypothetical protein WR25_24765 [Diploscapter pachys]|uniref:ShKT domain-containing protein n=1 Tax=Diploscapter pachys TaxID=2018661 RepID=A0A2A2KX06_9BILA|nr:hypothetical protein WR25_24765 [Diploscapter pachys]
MYLVLGLLASLLLSIQAQVADDYNCTYVKSAAPAGLAYSPLSVKCNDKLTAAQCLKFFVDPAVVPDDTTAKRPVLCYSTVGASPQPIEVPVQKMATEYCPKHCGYCCLTDAYDCDNKQDPAINCDTVTDSMCDDPAWRGLIAENWTCDRCNSTASSGSSTTASSGVTTRGGCSDTTQTCPTWRTNGFCTSTFYTAAQKRQYCAS